MKRFQLLAAIAVISLFPLSASSEDPQQALQRFKLLEDAQQAFEQGDLRAATEAYETATASQPDNAMLWYNLGCLQAMQNETADARVSLERALQLAPDLAKAHDALGQLDETSGKNPQARARYQMALSLDPSNELFLKHLFRAQLAGDDLEGLRQSAQRLAERDPADADACYVAGLLNLRGNKPELAVLDFKKAIRFHPGHRQAWNGLALAHSRLGEFSEADSAMQKALALAPNDAATLTNAGVVAAREQRMDAARQSWENAMRRDPGVGSAARNLEILMVPPKAAEAAGSPP